MDNSLASFRKKDIGRVGGENFNKWGNDEGDVDEVPGSVETSSLDADVEDSLKL